MRQYVQRGPIDISLFDTAIANAKRQTNSKSVQRSCGKTTDNFGRKSDLITKLFIKI